MNNNGSKFVLYLTGATALVLIAALWIAPMLTPNGKKMGTAAIPEKGTLPLDTSGRVVVSDQSAGESVLVDSVTVPPPGVWVAVREVSGTEIGNVLGAARARGPITGLTVPLLRATLPHQTYAVLLYRDDGDNTFELAADSVYVDFDTGKPVVAPFSTR